ncbi:hypothetical protein [Haladaptatus caseinilyticus]|uniref:hypothetical protein n=1 Tax=Haladaptatus caseinilyticus TaxID=2993314 RepID=UPI00224B2D51|nr:hypothetical protein [Haladaptatus caseinilyticus]
MGDTCTYCESDVNAHEPVFVDEERGGERTTVGQFCNYACLARYIEENELETGTCCRLDFT